MRFLLCFSLPSSRSIPPASFHVFSCSLSSVAYFEQPLGGCCRNILPRKLIFRRRPTDRLDFHLIFIRATDDRAYVKCVERAHRAYIRGKALSRIDRWRLFRGQVVVEDRPRSSTNTRTCTYGSPPPWNTWEPAKCQANLYTRLHNV